MKIKILLLIVLISISISFVGCKSQQSNSVNTNTTDIKKLEDANKNAQNTLKEQLRNNVVCDITQDSQNGNFTGYVENKSIKDIQNMNIKISFYDKDNSKLGEQIIIINGLKHDEKYKVDEILWSKYKSAKSWKITEKNITFTDSDYN